MAKQQKLKDPVDRGGKKVHEELRQELESMGVEESADAGDIEDFSFLSADELGTIQERRTKMPHPFDGYKSGRKIMVGECKVSSTFVSILNTGHEPPPDKSNIGQTVYIGGDGSGTPRGGGEAKAVDLPTSHTRMVTDRTGIRNETVVFDRDITLSDGRVMKCAIVRSHAARSQIHFRFDPRRMRAVPDKRYSLADPKQADRLFAMFQALYYQRTKAEQAAKEFDAAEETPRKRR